MDIVELLSLSVNHAASDLHISAGLSPLLRIDGELQRLEFPLIEQEMAQALIYQLMNPQQRQEFEQCWEIDFSVDIPNLARFRVNVFNQSRGIAAVIRTIPPRVLSLDELNLPSVFRSICRFSNGLVLITGQTGSGKSTTLAAMIDYINETEHHHILTIEDPIEFIHSSKKSLINQREVHRNTKDFNAALRSALREDPDIILIGEMRDLETIRLALTAAETGHLVFATLHTASAAKTINRIIDVFPSEEKNVIRTRLAETLQAVICQTLIKKIAGGRVPALEVMLCTPAIRNLIREDKVAQMYSTIQTSVGIGMQTLDHHLKELVRDYTISKQTAQSVAHNKENFV